MDYWIDLSIIYISRRLRIKRRRLYIFGDAAAGASRNAVIARREGGGLTSVESGRALMAPDARGFVVLRRGLSTS